VGLKPKMLVMLSRKRKPQQSHHCGIETHARYVRVYGTTVQQSHHCGIETALKVQPSPAEKLQQSHHCGIETFYFYGIDVGDFGSNRTIVGLKPSSNKNRSIVCGWQQSHHCGIETKSPTAAKSPIRKQQSHHCGIETRKGFRLMRMPIARSNRTIVGLKQM